MSRKPHILHRQTHVRCMPVNRHQEGEPVTFTKALRPGEGA